MSLDTFKQAALDAIIAHPGSTRMEWFRHTFVTNEHRNFGSPAPPEPCPVRGPRLPDAACGVWPGTADLSPLQISAP